MSRAIYESRASKVGQVDPIVSPSESSSDSFLLTMSRPLANCYSIYRFIASRSGLIFGTSVSLMSDSV